MTCSWYETYLEWEFGFVLERRGILFMLGHRRLGFWWS